MALPPQPSQRSSQLPAVLECVVPTHQQLHSALPRHWTLMLAVQRLLEPSELPWSASASQTMSSSLVLHPGIRCLCSSKSALMAALKRWCTSSTSSWLGLSTCLTAQQACLSQHGVVQSSCPSVARSAQGRPEQLLTLDAVQIRHQSTAYSCSSLAAG